MNRGILLARGIPSQEDLVKSARGICSNDEDALNLLCGTFNDMAKGYCHVYRMQAREYFGLRDFYSLVKMLFSIVVKEQRPLSPKEEIEVVQRNFGGYFGDFHPALEFLMSVKPGFNETDLISSKELIMAALKQPENPTETRYILLLTKNKAALRIIDEHNLLNGKFSVIYGSSFPHDQEYTQICYNINRIKIAMETGQTIVLTNLDNLYESLYDALNQNYMMLGGDR